MGIQKSSVLHVLQEHEEVGAWEVGVVQFSPGVGWKWCIKPAA